MTKPSASYQTQSAVLFIIFNRPDTTEKVFEQIKAAKPKRLYVAADGPRDDHPDEYLLCKQAREIVTQIDWECELKTLFREKNAGCKEAVSAAITWFFDNEEEGIILEDDCLPANSFFKFCDVLLERYRFDTRLRHIGGGNYQHGKKWGNASYYFSRLSHIWGWASWRRVWKEYDKGLSRYNGYDAEEALTTLFDDAFITERWLKKFSQVKAGEIDTWDYQLIFTNFFNNGLCILPNVNLISNIGFGSNATHTISSENTWANIPLEEINEIIHPVNFAPKSQADIDTLKEETDMAVIRQNKKLRRRFKRWLRSLLQPPKV